MLLVQQPRTRICEGCGNPCDSEQLGEAAGLIAEAVRRYIEDVLGRPLELLCAPCWAEFFEWAETEGRLS